MIEQQVVPECYFDTVLVRTALKLDERKRLNHQKGCSNVVRVMTSKLDHDFAVGIVDKDKRELDYLKQCDAEIVVEALVLWKHREKQHYFIQLAPALENWLLTCATDAGIDLMAHGLPSDLSGLKKKTKSELDSESLELYRLCKALLRAETKTIKTFVCWLEYLVREHRNADIDALKVLTNQIL